MCAKQLLKLLRDPRNITLKDAEALQDLLTRYPYFQSAYALLAKATYDREKPSAGQAVQTAAIYVTDRSHFKHLLDDTLLFAPPGPEATPTDTKPEEQDRTPKEAYYFVNDYINTIQKKKQRKVTRSQSLVQLNSIQAFLQKNVNLQAQLLQAAPDKDFQVDLTQQSTAFHDELATETLDKILCQQGKLQRALAIYEKLMLRFPEKRTYFASLIETIKHEI